MVSFFFSVDFEMLSDTERDILRVIGEQRSSTSNSIEERLEVDSIVLRGSLHRLEPLGYARRNTEGRYALVPPFFSRWFRELPMAGSRRNAPQPAPTAQLDSEETTRTDMVDLGIFDARYELLKRVGKGATGIVYRAHDKLLRVDVAIKLLKPEYSGHEEAVERLRREVLLTRDIAHPDIVNVYHFGDCDGRKYVTMRGSRGRHSPRSSPARPRSPPSA